MWIDVPSRLPSAPKMLPRMPMAAGTSTSRPGRASSVPVMAPRVSPARRSPPEETSSAASACRNPAASEPIAARRRAKKRVNGRESTATRRVRRAGRHTRGMLGAATRPGRRPTRRSHRIGDRRQTGAWASTPSSGPRSLACGRPDASRPRTRRPSSSGPPGRPVTTARAGRAAVHGRASGLAGGLGALLRRARAGARRRLRPPLADRAHGPRGGGPAARRWARGRPVHRRRSDRRRAGPPPAWGPGRGHRDRSTCRGVREGQRRRGLRGRPGRAPAALAERRGGRGHLGRALRPHRRAAGFSPATCSPTSPASPSTAATTAPTCSCGPQPAPPGSYAPVVRCCSNWGRAGRPAGAHPRRPRLRRRSIGWSTTTVTCEPSPPDAPHLPFFDEFATPCDAKPHKERAKPEEGRIQRAAARAAAGSSATRGTPPGPGAPGGSARKEARRWAT